MSQLQLTKVNKMNSQWVPLFILRTLGYSSFVAAILSLILHWYKKQNMARPCMKEKTACKKPDMNINTVLRRSNSTFSNLSSSSSFPLTPPPSPLTIDSNKHRSMPGNSRPTSPLSQWNSRPTSPLSHWSSRILDGVKSMGNIMKRKKLTLSLKNTILWNPSSDVDTPNHAFHENAALFLSKLASTYDIYVIVHVVSTEERQQIQELLENAQLIDPALIDERKVLYCNSEQGKLHLIQHINPSIHVEGGWEKGNGSQIVQSLTHLSHLVWVLPLDAHQQYSQHTNIEFADHILHTSLAKQL